MKLTHDEINTVALLIEQKPEGLRSVRDKALYKRITGYYYKDIGVVRIDTSPDDKLQTEYEKDLEEDEDGRYR